jgi:CheY-like chemotaxis protein
MIVDDNGLGLAARKSVLEELGYRTTGFSCALEALAQLASGEFDLIITDYRMPNMNGIEFIGLARERKPLVPIILLSGFADSLGLDERNTGADAVIQKSANEVTHLLRTVNKLLRRTPRKPAGSHRTAPKGRRKGV